MTITGYYFMVLDIETSTIYNENNEPVSVWLSYGYCNLYDRKGYVINRFLFREWKNLSEYFNNIQNKFPSHKILCYVHNLSFEFDFLIKNISRPKNFLTNSSHGIISSILEDYPHIEFRCSFRLTMHSLKKIGEQIDLPKLEDPYTNILPEDDIEITRLQYCCRDCDIVAKYIVDVLLKEFGTLPQIPLTKTGRVRKIFNEYYQEEKERLGDYPLWDLQPPEDCFQAMEDAFSGGITTSSIMYTGIILRNVHSYDITSSYPYVQLKELFPFSIEKEIGEIKMEFLKEKFWIAKIKFTNIHAKYPWGWLSVSKMQSYDELTSEFFNGKLLHSSEIVRTITNVDFEMIELTYDFDNIEIIEFYHMYDFGKIPYPYIKTIEKFAMKKYELKTALSQIDETHPDFAELNIEYMLAKNDFNSIYGMSVQKLVQQEYYIDENFLWHKKDRKYVNKGKHMKRNFLIGLFVTAYARRNLLRAIVKNCPYTFVYCDTDSIKYVGNSHFMGTNGRLKKYRKNKALSKLGKFDREHDYKEFITWGAKKYAYKLNKDNGIYLTVAGLPKYKNHDEKTGEAIFVTVKLKGVEKEFNSLDMFVPGVKFEKCKNGKKYIVDEKYFETEEDENGAECINIKYQDQATQEYLKQHNIVTNGGVALFPVDYELDITRNDRKVLKKTRKEFYVWVQKVIGIPQNELMVKMLPID